MKFHQSKILNNINMFSKLMRCSNDMFLFWKICEYFQPKSVLEIGFHSGQTFGLMVESADRNCKFTSVDISYRNKKIFDRLFNNFNGTFLEISSRDLNLTEKYDFVHIDGDHSYEYVLNDFNKVKNLLHRSSILCMDDFCCSGVAKVIEENLLGQFNFVPFMLGENEMFFHHESQSIDDFLDVWIQNKAKNFMNFYNTNYFGYTLLKSQTPHIFEENKMIYLEALKFYDL